ncbi:MAG: hypothetical protein Q4G44_08015 [Alcaligenaceae bacterium]|nr:hypothetical protein [Alcaligenaceae bacterium]
MQVFKKIKDFVQGQIELSELQDYLNHDFEAVATLKRAQAIPPFTGRDRDAFAYLNSLDAQCVEDCLHAQDMLSCLLNKNEIKYKATKKYERIHDFKNKVQPKWLLVDEVVLQSILDSFDKSSGKSFIKYAKSKLAESYKIKSKPPKWLQEPQWPISSAGRPLTFVEQKKSEHEQAISCEYVFLDEDTGEYKTIMQTK